MLTDQEREAIVKELDYLNGQRARGLSRQMEAQVGWMQARLEQDRLERQAQEAAAVLARIRESHRAAKARVDELKAVIADRLAVPTEEILSAAGEVAALAGELAGMEMIERELRKRSREQEATTREISNAIKQQTSKVMSLRVRTGIPG